MAQFINKAAVVVEINKRIMDAPINYIGHQRVWAYNDVKDILDTLEVKDFEVTWEDVAWIVNKAILLCKVESILTAEDICKEVLKQFKAQKGE